MNCASELKRSTTRCLSPTRIARLDYLTTFSASLRFGPGSGPAQAVPDQQPGTTGDGAVRQVECRPVVLGNMKVQKIHDRAKQQTVDQVAQGSAEDQAEGETK